MRIQVEGIIRYVDSSGRIEISLPSVRYKNISADGKAVILNNHPSIKHLSADERKSLKGKHVIVTVDILNDAPSLPTAEGLIEEYFDNFVRPFEIKPMDPVVLKHYIRQWVQDTHYVSRRVLEKITAKLIMQVAKKLNFKTQEAGTIFQTRKIFCEVLPQGIPGSDAYKEMVKTVWIS